MITLSQQNRSMDTGRACLRLWLIALTLPGWLTAGVRAQTVTLPMDAKEVSLSPSGKVLALREPDGRLIVWDVMGQERLAIIDAKQVAPAPPALSEDDQHLAFGAPGNRVSIIDWQSKPWKLIADCANVEASALAFAPDRKSLATGDRSGRVQLWDARTGKELDRITAPAKDASPVRRLVFADDGKTLLWETERDIHVARLRGLGPPKFGDHEILGHFGASRTPRLLAMTPDAHLLVAATDENVVLYDLRARKQTDKLALSAELIALHMATASNLVGRAVGFVDVNGNGGLIGWNQELKLEVFARRPLAGLEPNTRLRSASFSGDLRKAAFVKEQHRAVTANFVVLETAALKKKPDPTKTDNGKPEPKKDGPFIAKNGGKQGPPKNGPVKSKSGDKSAVIKDASPKDKRPEAPKSTDDDDKLGVEIFYGTNRKVREAGSVQAGLDQIWHEVFWNVFSTSTGWWIGIRLALVVFMPPALIWLFTRQGWCGRMCGGLLTALFAAFLAAGFLEGGWRRLDPWFLLALTAAAAVIFFLLAIANAKLAWMSNLAAFVKLTLVVVIGAPFTVAIWAILEYLHAERMTAAERFAEEPDRPEVIYTSQYSERLHYGICRIHVPERQPGEPIRFPLGEVGLLGVRRINPDRDFYFTRIELYHEPERRGVFFKRLNDSVHAAGNADKEAFIYIHGYNNSFREVAFRAAALKVDLKRLGMPMEGPMIFFSWPARGYVEDYPADEEAVDYCQPFFEQFLREVTEHSGAERVYLIAHSMGNRALAEALVNLQRSRWDKLDRFQHVVLAAPDINRDKFLWQLMPDLLNLNRPLTLYASNHDRALQVSRTFHKNTRAGLAGTDMIVSKGTLSAYDVSSLRGDFMGHDYAFSQAVILTDLTKLWVKEPVAADRRGWRESKGDGGVYWTRE